MSRLNSILENHDSINESTAPFVGSGNLKSTGEHVTFTHWHGVVHCKAFTTPKHKQKGKPEEFFTNIKAIDNDSDFAKSLDKAETQFSRGK